MRSEHCDAIQPELSAYIDDELMPDRRQAIEQHLNSCSECRAEETSLRAVRRLVRVQAVEQVPDLAPAIMARVQRQKVQVLAPWRERLRVASVSAAAAALVVLGASLPFGTDAVDVANATEITDRVRAAARALDAYEATFSIVERGWHPEVPVRNMTASVAFEAPETIRMQIVDDTDYPSAQWPRNNVKLVADADRWWIREPSSCPPAGLPECASPVSWAGVIERRTVVDRQPFDGTTGLPTDIVIPLQTLAGSDGFRVLGRTQVLERDSYRLMLNARDAVPLIDALQAGGSWREFHPLDEVEVLIDSETWFPLHFEVRAGNAPDRQLWAERRGLMDEPGDSLLEVTTTSLAEPAGGSDAFDVPTTGIRQDGGFREGAVPEGLEPAFDGGLVPYRSGRAGTQQVATFSDGMTYLKVVRSEGKPTGDLRVAEELELGGGFAYYFPATETLGRHVEIFDEAHTYQLFSNLERDTLFEVARSLPVEGERAADIVRKAGGVTIERLDPRIALREFGPHSLLPRGYSAASASRTRLSGAVETVTLYLRRPEGEFEGLGIRVVSSAPVAFLPPSSEEFVDVMVGDHLARWSADRGELEWLAGSNYRAVLVPSGDLSTAIQIAEAMR
jgi:hypothetical protein